jgi:hypothetical protein
MKQLGRACGVVFMLCVLLVSNGGMAAAQDETSRYFPLSGHYVSGEFWRYYQTFPDASFIFGDPITEQFSEPTSGRVVQYFQRARFEYYPENPAGQRVSLSPLGMLIMPKSPTGNLGNNFSPIGCRFYAETGFSVCYAFLDFFNANGGQAVFGKPISPFMGYNGRIVQYFERARFEWYPEYPDGNKVRLAELGRIYFDLAPEDPNRLQPVRAENAPGDVRSLISRAFTWKATTSKDDEQVVYVVVQDQTLRPVSGATTVVTVTWSQGGSRSFAQTSNASGFSSVPIQVRGEQQGSLVIIDVEVLYNGLASNTRTSFRIWQ